MAITKAKKKEIFEKVSTELKGANSAVFVNFHGLKVSQATALRRKLKAADVTYFVAKKTITRKALEAQGVTGTMPTLDGEVGIAYGADLLAPAREVYEFQKKNKDSLAILGGVFEGAYKTKEEMVAIANIPPLKTLYAMFANVINSPIQGLVIALNAVAGKKA